MIDERLDSDIYNGKMIVMTSLETKFVFIVNRSVALLTEFMIVEMGTN